MGKTFGMRVKTLLPSGRSYAEGLPGRFPRTGSSSELGALSCPYMAHLCHMLGMEAGAGIPFVLHFEAIWVTLPQTTHKSKHSDHSIFISRDFFFFFTM